MKSGNYRRVLNFADNGKNATVIETPKLASLVDDWLAYGDLEGHSPRTIAQRRIYTNRLLQFLWAGKHATCGPSELLRFFSNLDNKTTGAPLRPSAKETYHRNLAAFFNWLSENTGIESPMRGVPKPRVPKDQLQPLSDAQIKDLLEAARTSYFPTRNQAIVLFLLDTGIRASEITTLTFDDLDLANRRASVIGKGNKIRTVYFGKRTQRALYQHLHGQRIYPEKRIFSVESGRHLDEPMTRSGIFKIVAKCGVAAGIRAARCSPHTLRHTFAINYLRSGGNLLSLKLLLGHESLSVTQRYCAIAESDLESRSHSLTDRIGR